MHQKRKLSKKSVVRELKLETRLPSSSGTNQITSSGIVNSQHKFQLVILSTGIGLLSFWVYLRTLYPSVAGGDSTEFAFAACQFSVPHPPGYPTFLMLSHAFVRLLPWWGSAAARANAAAAACGSGAAALVSLAAWEATGHAPAALAAAGVFAFGRLVWSYAIQSEVFALNNLFAAALLYLAAKYDRSPSDRTAYLGAFVCGLALTNQHTIIFYIAPIALFVLARGGRALLTPPKVAALSLLGIAGLLPYAVIAWRSSFGLPGSWGDLTTVQGFLTHILRREYGTFRLFAGAERGDHRFWLGLRLYATNLVREMHPLGAALLLFGIVAAFVGSKARAGADGRRGLFPGARLCVGCWALYTVVFHYIGNLPIEQELYLGVHERFWMQAHVAAHVLMGVGASAAGRGLDALFPAAGAAAGRPPWLSPSAVVAVAAVAAQIGRNYRAVDESGNFHVLRFGRELLRPLPANARLLVKGDLITNTARYLQVCEGYRDDVQMADMSMMTYPWFKKVQAKNLPGFVWPNAFYHPFQPEGYSMRQFLEANMKAGDVFMAGGWYPNDPTPLAAFGHLPWGLASKVVRACGGPF
uniref:Transmembrane protein n=1 Tax=Tetraselmis sp. GSL018 TaxID=582737 RepID=A0A061RP57_9CHLO